MKNLISKIIVIALISLSACAQYPQSLAVKKITNPGKYNTGQNVQGSNIVETTNTIEILDGLGGWINDWKALATYAYISHKQVRIHQNCLSACTVMASEIRRLGGDICVFENAQFGYHKARIGRGVWVSSRENYTPDIINWVDMHGGWPAGWPFTTQEGVELQKFYKLCDQKQPG